MSDTDDELADLRREVEEIKDNFRLLSLAVGDLQQDALTPTKWWWPDMNQAQAKDAWEALTPWVDTFVEWRGRRSVEKWYRECWYAHPVALGAMTALFLEHRDAYNSRGRGYEKTNWLDRAMKAMTEIIQYEVGGCGDEQRTGVNRCTVLGELKEGHRDNFIAEDIAKRVKLHVSGGEHTPPPDLDDL